jgi:D-alanine-D-alanine ligase
MDFSGLPEGTPRVLDAKAKFDESSEEYQGTRAVMAELDDVMKARMQQVALNAYRAVRVRDYGRIDLRLTDAGEIYVIEVNASCYLEEQSEFAMAAAAAGIDYVTLVNRITELAMDRWKAPKQPARRRKQRGGGDSKGREKATA